MDTTNVFVVMANNAVASGQWQGIGNVRVLNLSNGAGTEAQDQLTLVPEPATSALLALGAAPWWRAAAARAPDRRAV